MLTTATLRKRTQNPAGTFKTAAFDHSATTPETNKLHSPNDRKKGEGPWRAGNPQLEVG